MSEQRYLHTALVIGGIHLEATCTVSLFLTRVLTSKRGRNPLEESEDLLFLDTEISQELYIQPHQHSNSLYFG